MKHTIILALAGIISLSSCTMGDGGSGHRTPRKSSDTMFDDSISCTKRHVKMDTHCAVKLLSNGAIMTVDNPENAYVVEDDTVCITNFTNSEWVIDNSGLMTEGQYAHKAIVLGR